MLFGVFLFSCNIKDEKVKFAVLKDEGNSAIDLWEKFQDVSLDESGIFNPGVTPHLWWMKVRLQSTQNEPGRHLFKLNNPHINRLEVYEENSGIPIWVVGDNFPFNQRPFWDRDLVIPVYLEAFESKVLLISIDKIGETLLVEPELLSENEFLHISSITTLFMGMVTGWMGVILFAACFFAWYFREMSGFFYALFILSSTFWVFSHWGLGFQYIWPENLVWANKARPIFNLTTNVFFLLLLLNFFPPLKHPSKLAWAMYLLIGLFLFFALNLVFRAYSDIPLGNRVFYLRLIFILSILMSFLIIYYLFQQMRAKVTYAGYYLSAISILLVIYVLQLLHQLGISIGVPNYVFDYSSSIGMLIESVFITAAFAGRAASYKKEKDILSMAVLKKEKEIADRMIQVQEEERNRLARDLHDSIGGMLCSIYLQVDKIQKQVSLPDETNKLKQMVSKSIDEARSLSHNLTPPHLEGIGLETALQNQVQLMADQHQLSINYYYRIDENLKQPMQLMLYRICGELLYNVVKHANASEVMLQLLSENQHLEIIVEDDGLGMEKVIKSKGIGLRNMRERVEYLKGDIHIDSNEKGTTVIIKIPI